MRIEPLQLVISHLNKTYPNGVRALRDICLEIPSGMFGLLGPNGAGKSSLMRTIATLQEADSGSIIYGDVDVLHEKDKVRRFLGYLPQEFGFYPNVSAEVVLDHFASLKGYTRYRERKQTVDALLAQTNLHSHRKKNVGGFSGGMKQRLGIAIALLGQPKLIIVDEPTAGLDPGERNRFLNLLGEISGSVIVILSTHIVEDVHDMCSNMAIMANGAVSYTGSPDALTKSIAGSVWRKTADKSEMEDLNRNHQVISMRWQAGCPVVHVYSAEQPGPDFTPAPPSLVDAYFHILSKSNEEPALS